MELDFIGLDLSYSRVVFTDPRTGKIFYLQPADNGKCVGLFEMVGERNKLRYRFKLGQSVSDMIFDWKNSIGEYMVRNVKGLTPKDDVILA